MARRFTGLLFLLLLSGCSLFHRKAEVVSPPLIQLIPGGDVIEASGVGLPQYSSADEYRKRSFSFKNAVRMAHGELETIAMGLEMSDGTLMKDFIGRDPVRLNRLRKILRKSKIIRKGWTQDLGCAVRLRIQKKVIEKKLKVTFK